MVPTAWPLARHDLGYGLLLTGVLLLLVMRTLLLTVMLGPELAGCGLAGCVTQAQGLVRVGAIHALGSRYFVRLVEARMAASPATGLPFVVVVDSPGGDFAAATRMVAALRALDAQQPVRIEIWAGERCQSMCTLLWTAASTRVAAATARFMFHGPGFGPSRQPGDGLEVKAAVMAQAVRRVDPVLAGYLAARQAFEPAGPQVELTAAAIAALGGNYLRLDPALR